MGLEELWKQLRDISQHPLMEPVYFLGASTSGLVEAVEV